MAACVPSATGELMDCFLAEFCTERSMTEAKAAQAAQAKEIKALKLQMDYIYARVGAPMRCEVVGCGSGEM
jgi:hypothetical protein